jgi:hypothetical protein
MRGDCSWRDCFLLLLCMHMGGAHGELAGFFCVCIGGLLLMALSPFCCLDICIWSIALHFDR